MQCFDFHFSSFMDFILDLSMCFRASAFSEADFSSLFSNSGSYFPFELGSILGY